MPRAHSTDGESQNQSSLRDHSSRFLYTLQELTLSAGMPLSVWKCFSFYRSFLLRSFKTEWKFCSSSLCFWKTNGSLTSPEMIFLFLKDSFWCGWFKAKLSSLLPLYVMEYVGLGQVKSAGGGRWSGILNMCTLTLKLNCFSFSVP